MAIVESRKSYDPRILLFYALLGLLLLILVGGLAFRQLLRSDEYVEREKVLRARLDHSELFLLLGIYPARESLQQNPGKSDD